MRALWFSLLSLLLAAAAAAQGIGPTPPSSAVKITGGSINNTPIGSTTPSTGAFSTLGTGNVTYNGAGFWSFVGGPSGYLFKDSSSNILLRLTGTGATDLITANVPITIAPNTTALSGTWGANTSAPFLENITWTGSMTAAGGFYTNYYGINFNAATNDATKPYGIIALQSSNGANLTGDVYNIDSNAAGSTTPTNAGFNPEFHGGRFNADISANMNGISGTPSGIGVGVKCSFTAESPATFLNEGIGCEMLTQNAAQIDSVYGAYIFDNSTVQGTTEHDGISIFATSTSPGYITGIMLGNRHQGSPCGTGSTCTLIASEGLAAASFNAGNGVDFHLTTFSGNSWNDGNFQFTGGGEFVASKITASGAAPGAAKMKFDVVAGTTAGTCKLIAYAGTSTTPVTVVDNVGSGC
jgi:hypothetical protein